MGQRSEPPIRALPERRRRERGQRRQKDEDERPGAQWVRMACPFQKQTPVAVTATPRIAAVYPFTEHCAGLAVAPFASARVNVVVDRRVPI